MTLSELIAAVGDENVAFQNLDECATNINFDHKKGTKITFGTDAQVNVDGTVKLGLVLWLDRKAVKDAEAKAQQEGEAFDEAKCRAEFEDYWYFAGLWRDDDKETALAKWLAARRPKEQK